MRRARTQRCRCPEEGNGIPNGSFQNARQISPAWRGQIELNEKEEALALETHAGERYGWAQFRVHSLHQMGRLREAAERSRLGIAHCARTGDRRIELFLRDCYARCLADLGELSQGEKQARDGAREADDLGLVAHRITFSSCLSYVLVRQGRFDEAAAAARTGVDAWKASGSKGMGLGHGAVLAEGLLAGGALEESREALDAHLVLAESTKSRHRAAQNLRVRGLLHAREGRKSEAFTSLSEAIAEFEACESAIELARALADRAGFYKEAGRESDAGRDLSRAKGILAASGASLGILGLGTKSESIGTAFFAFSRAFRSMTNRSRIVPSQETPSRKYPRQSQTGGLAVPRESAHENHAIELHGDALGAVEGSEEVHDQFSIAAEPGPRKTRR